jgi:hypothetical protein
MNETVDSEKQRDGLLATRHAVDITPAVDDPVPCKLGTIASLAAFHEELFDCRR